MNHHFSSGQGYPSQYLNAIQHPPGSTPTTSQSHAHQYPAPNGPHILPPLAPPQYGSAHSQEMYMSRPQQLPSSLPTSGPSTLHQPTLMPIYAPTATTYFSTEAPPVSTYTHPPTAHQSSGPLISQYAPPQSHLPSIQPAVSQPTRLPVLQPMPNPNVGNEDILTAKAGRSLASAQVIGEEPPPLHVVGAQGRRGILPSAAGRPPAIGENAPSRQKGPAAPAKDAAGKYPCEHCPKTYQHAKHLKRHMLRRKSGLIVLSVCVY